MESNLEQLIRETMGAGTSDQGGRLPTLFSILVGVVRPPPAVDGESDLPPDRLVLVNPVTQGMVVLHGDPAVVAEILSDMAVGVRTVGPPPASKASIEALPTVEFKQGEGGGEEECSVCLDTLSSGGIGGGEAAAVKEMPCGHRFHAGCIEKWLGMRGSCPVCRLQMPAEEEEEPKKGGGGGGEGETDGDEEEAERRRRQGIWVTLVYRRSSRRDRQSDGAT